MRRGLVITTLCALLVCAPLARVALADATPVPEASPVPAPATASDQIQREQLRLIELGYRLTPISGIADEAHAAAMSAFLLENGLSDDMGADAINAVLFSAEAKPAPFVETAVSLGRSLHDTPFATGLALTWSDVSQRLTTGEIYQLTSCTSGIIFRMRHLGGSGHAELSPELSWDDATLYSLLHADGGSRKMPVVVSIGALRIAASIQLNTILPDASGGMHRYCLYFSGSVSDFTGIADAEHQYLIRYATETGEADVADGAQSEAAVGDDTATPEPSLSPDAAPTATPEATDIPPDNMAADDSD